MRLRHEDLPFSEIFCNTARTCLLSCFHFNCYAAITMVALRKIDHVEMKVSWTFGTTCTIASGICEKISEDENLSYSFEVGHVGEAMAYSILFDGSLIPITKPHTPINNLERERVEKLGGYTTIQRKDKQRNNKDVVECVTVPLKDTVDEESLPIFEPGHTRVSRCLGGKKRKLACHPNPFLIAEPEIYKVQSKVNDDKKVLGIIVCTDGVYSYRGARFGRLGNQSSFKLEELVRPIVKDMIDRLKDDNNRGREEKYQISRKASKDISKRVVLASKDEQVKLEKGDNISVATIICSHLLLGI